MALFGSVKAGFDDLTTVERRPRGVSLASRAGMLERIRGRLLGVDVPVQRIGSYRVVRELARGGFGRVLECWDDKLDRTVAIKVVEANGRSVAAIRREATATAKVQHPRVVVVLDTGVHDGQAYVVMQLVRGIPLREWQRSAESWKALVRSYIEVGRGLAAAHAVGVIHRDLKPDNVIVDPEGNPTIVDFGLAQPNPHREPDDVAVTASHQTRIVGTPEYMAPEQMSGTRADERSDQYSLAASLFEAVYGALPYPGHDTYRLMQSIGRGDLRPRPADDLAPKQLYEVLARALSLEPERRWPTVSAFVDELADVEQGVAPRRHSRAAVAVGVALALLLAAVMWLAVGGSS